MKKIIIILMSLVLITMTSCVSTKKYQEVVTKNEVLIEKNTELTKLNKRFIYLLNECDKK